MTRVVADRVADLREQARERPVRDEGSGPEPLVDLLLRNDARPVPNQEVQDLKSLGLEMDLRSADEQLARVRVENAIPEVESHRSPQKSRVSSRRRNDPARRMAATIMTQPG